MINFSEKIDENQIYQAIGTRLIISHVLAQITKSGPGNKHRGHLFHLFGRSYGYRSAFARVRYRAKPDADGGYLLVSDWQKQKASELEWG